MDRKQELDILMWWKSLLYYSPSLVDLARDVLSIPVAPVASESSFSVGGRIFKAIEMLFNSRECRSFDLD